MYVSPTSLIVTLEQSAYAPKWEWVCHEHSSIHKSIGIMAACSITLSQSMQWHMQSYKQTEIQLPRLHLHKHHAVKTRKPVKSTNFISGLYLPYDCLLPFTLKQPMSGSLRAPSRSANTHSLSLFIAEYGQPNALKQTIANSTTSFCNT